MALPAFSFNPGASLPAEPLSPMLLSPPISPNTPRTGASAQRPGGFGHRRGGSEFVGGRLRDGNSIAVMSTSPTKSESGFASPTFQPPRRGHRRGVSSAVSSNAIPILPSSFNDPATKGSSAPNSPTDFQKAEFVSFPHPQDPPTPPEPEIKAERLEEPELGPEPQESKTTETPAPDAEDVKPAPRARVGFSDTLEFIPRPLSLVSSDTSSTMTAKPGHSVTGSMSSLISLSSPGDFSGRGSPSPLSRSPTRALDESRPSTAGAVLEHALQEPTATQPISSPKRRNSIPTLLATADIAAGMGDPTPSPSKSSKRWSFFGLDAFASSNSPTKGRPQSAGSNESISRAVSVGSSSEHGSESIGEASESAGSMSKKERKEKKHKKRKKRATAWAGAILPRKPKGQSKREKISERPPTPPPAVVPPEDEDEEQDNTTPQALASPPPTVTITESQGLPAETAAPKKSSDEPSTPMIDLDAALGPFNTPLPNNAEWDAAQYAAGNLGKRRLHSAQGLKGFSGPGMHYHRRAESAPDLPPFDPGRHGIHRFGSSSTMADVFEEDEEDDGAAKASAQRTGYSSDAGHESDGEMTPPAIAPKESASEVQDFNEPMVRRKSSGLSDKDHNAAHAVRNERSKTSLHDNVIVEDHPSIIFRSANVFQNRPESSHSAAASYRKSSGGRELAPVDIGPLHSSHSVTLPVSPYSTSLASSYPSPRSPMSVDAQRISTAPSSVNDENNFHSLLMGEPGPEVRISMDYDIPSLTSSNSTMTRDSAFTGPSPRLPKPSSREVRPMSVGSSAFGRRRSSLVSLSRLISSSHGERSKLSMEVTLDNDGDKKKSKGSKSRRLGRLMNFWKPNKEGNQET